MLAGAAAGAGMIGWWPPAAVIAVAAALVAGVAVAFMTAVPATARKPLYRASRPALQA
jgi:hypothetical protein